MTASPFLDEILIRARHGMGQTSVSDRGAKPRAERIWKSFSSSGSAFVKRIPGAGVQHIKQLKGQLAYINGKAQGTFGNASWVTFGDEMDKDELAQMMEAWSADWKGRPRNGHTSHMVLSFPDDVSPAAALAISQEWCAEMFEEEVHAEDTWEYIAALHTDTENPHVHVVINNKGDNGTWFALSAEGTFTPQMMRDRMTELAEDFGVLLESTTRADRGIYTDPITNEDFWASCQPKLADSGQPQKAMSDAMRQADMVETARLYSVLADFAQLIGAPIVAKRAYLSASLLSAGKAIEKGNTMDIDLDVTADRSEIRTTLIDWTEQNRELIDGLPERDQNVIMTRIEEALNIIESDVSADLTDDTVWAGFKDIPSSYLIHDVGALEARAALYVDEDQQDVLHEFVTENVLDRYLVTGQVPSKYEAVLPAVADAYEEMHSHRLAAIPKEMKAYVERATAMGLDPLSVQERLINSVDDPVENAQMEREDVARIMEARGEIDQPDEQQYDAAYASMVSAADASLSDGVSSELDVFENFVAGVEIANRDPAHVDGWSAVAREVIFLTGKRDQGELSPDQMAAYDAVIPVLLDANLDDMRKAVAEAERRERLIGREEPEMGESPDAYEQRMDMEEAQTDISLLRIAGRHGWEAQARASAVRAAQSDYRDLQSSLADVEQKIINDSRVVDPEGFRLAIQDAASTAYTTNRADFESPAVARDMLRSFVALEGRGAMEDISNGVFDPLAQYLDTPAHQTLAAKELLKSAKTVDVGLELDDIENALEAIDPDYVRAKGISL